MSEEQQSSSLIDKFFELPSLLHWLVLGGIILCLIALGYGVEYFMRSDTIKQELKRQVSIQLSIAVAKKREQKLQQSKDEAVLFLKQRNTMLAKLPQQAEMDKILKTITSIGHEAGLSFVRFKPELEKNQGFYAEIPIKIIALGNYHQMATFMSNVANLNDLFTIHDFKIKRDKPTEEVLTMHVSLRVYQQKFKVQLPIVPVAIPTVPKKQYQAQKQRDPFERPNTDQKKTSKQLYANAILTNVSVSSLKLIGTVSQNNRIWAMIATPQGNIVRITVGYRVGNNQALVTQITENQVKFKVDTDDKDKPRILTITMDEPS